MRDLGRQLLDNLLSVLLLSICDAIECVTLPDISLESLLFSASRVKMVPARSSLKDCGARTVAGYCANLS